MDWQIAGFLTIDGITSGAIYALLALSLVLVFSVTRVILVPLGELVAFGALTLALLEYGTVPATTWLLLGLGVLTFVLEAVRLLHRRGQQTGIGRALGVNSLKFLLFPIAMHLLVQRTAAMELPMAVDMLITALVVVPMGPMIYRLAFQPVAEASVLVLLIIAVAVHFALAGIGLVMFGPEGWRGEPMWDASFEIATLPVSGQSLAVVASALILIAALYLYFGRTLSGKALRATAVNRLGARLVGVGTAQAGQLAFTLATAIGVLCGMLIVPMTSMNYDGGFLIALKGFVGAIIGAMVSFPLAAAGALLVGLLEAFASFWASAYKEVIVFTLILPVLLWRSLTSGHHADEEE
jgi:branched-chain amino acid transport system permease protein